MMDYDRAVAVNDVEEAAAEVVAIMVKVIAQYPNPMEAQGIAGAILEQAMDNLTSIYPDFKGALFVSMTSNDPQEGVRRIKEYFRL